MPRVVIFYHPQFVEHRLVMTLTWHFAASLTALTGLECYGERERETRYLQHLMTPINGQ